MITNPGILSEPEATAAYLAELGARSHAIAREKGWWPGAGKDPCYALRNMGEMLFLVTSELAEALEVSRESDFEPSRIWYSGKRKEGTDLDTRASVRHFSSPVPVAECVKPEGFVVEIADAIIRLAETLTACGRNDEKNYQFAIHRYLANRMESQITVNADPTMNQDPVTSSNIAEQLLIVDSQINDAYWQYKESSISHPFPTYLASVIVSLLAICDTHKIDVVHAIALKEEYNKTRPIRHGGKRF